MGNSCCSCSDDKKWRISLLIVNTVASIATSVFDWALFIDLITIKEGIVYGPVDKYKVNGILAISIVGSILSLASICIHIKNYVSEEHKRALLTGLELVKNGFYQLPKGVIKYQIISCREFGINLIIFGSSVLDIFITFIILFIAFYAFIKFLCKFRQEQSLENMCYVIALCLTTVSTVVVIGLGITVAVFSTWFRDTNGGLSTATRFNLWSKTYNMPRYFEHVSVYFSHPKLDKDLHYNQSQLDWIQLYPFYEDVLDRGIGLQSPDCFPSKTLTHKIKFSDVPNTDIFFFQISKSGSDNIERYKVFRDRGIVSDTDEIPEIEKYHAYTIIIKSKFISSEEDSSRPFGTIHFNWLIQWPDKSCSTPNITFNTNCEHSKSSSAGLHYFKLKDTGVSSHTHLLRKNGTIRFFNPAEDLIDIGQIWRPGFHQCSSTGEHCPTLDTSLDVPCKK